MFIYIERQNWLHENTLRFCRSTKSPSVRQALTKKIVLIFLQTILCFLSFLRAVFKVKWFLCGEWDNIFIVLCMTFVLDLIISLTFFSPFVMEYRNSQRMKSCNLFEKDKFNKKERRWWKRNTIITFVGVVRIILALTLENWIAFPLVK